MCHATNGEVFHDPTGDFTRRREAFGAFPENVRRFKLAGRAWRIDIQRYQMERCIAHGEDMAADLMLHEGLREVFHFVCLVNRRYAPQDRWLHWFARRLPILTGEIEPLVSLIRETTDVRVRLSRFLEILDALSGYVYREGLATRGDYEWASLPHANPWWADLLRTVTGDQGFPRPRLGRRRIPVRIANLLREGFRRFLWKRKRRKKWD